MFNSSKIVNIKDFKHIRDDKNKFVLDYNSKKFLKYLEDKTVHGPYEHLRHHFIIDERPSTYILPEAFKYLSITKESPFPYFNYTKEEMNNYDKILKYNKVNKVNNNLYCTSFVSSSGRNFHSTMAASDVYIISSIIIEECILHRPLKTTEKVMAKDFNYNNIDLHNLIVVDLDTHDLRFVMSNPVMSLNIPTGFYNIRYKFIPNEERVCKLQKIKNLDNILPQSAVISYHSNNMKACKVCGKEYFEDGYNKGIDCCSKYCADFIHESYHLYDSYREKENPIKNLVTREDFLEAFRECDFCISTMMKRYNLKTNDKITKRLKFFGLFALTSPVYHREYKSVFDEFVIA